MTTLLAVSLLLQIVAAALALRLVRVSGKPVAWILIAAAILLMAFRRAIALVGALQGTQAPDAWGEIVALTISVLMVAGIASIEKLLKRVRNVDEMVPQLLESAPEAMVIADESDRIVLVNAQTVRLFGWPRHQLLGQDVQMLMPDRFRARHLAARARYHEQPRHRSMGADAEFFGLRKDGTEFPVEISVSPLVTGRGRYVVSSIRDTSAARGAEKALRESEGRYRSLLDDVLESSSVGVCILDKERRIVWVNRTFAGFFGVLRRDLIGEDGRAVGRERLASCVAEAEEFRRQLERSLREGAGTETFAFRVTGNEQRVERWLEHRSQPIESGLYAGGRIEHYTDVSEARLAEERIRLFVHIARSMQIGLLVYRLEDAEDDRTLRIVTINPEAEKLLGVSREDLLGKLIDEAFPVLRERGLPQLFADVIRTGHTREMQDFVYGDARVLEHVWSFKAFPLPGDSVGVAFESITDRKRTEALIGNIAAGVGGETGDKFFRSLVTYLAKALDLEYAFVGELTPDGKAVQTVAGWEDGRIGASFRYELEGAPCAFVVNRRLCCYPEGVSERFPEDRLLREMRVESYVGAPLFDTDGAPLGLIAVLGRRRLENPETAESVLRIFAARAAAELERRRQGTRAG